MGPFCSTQKKTCGTSFKKKREKPFLKTQSRVLSLLTHSAKKKSLEAFLSLSLTLLFPSSSSPLKLHQSSNLCTPFLLQIVKGSHFRSRAANLYVVGLQISGLGRLLSHMISWVLGVWEI